MNLIYLSFQRYRTENFSHTGRMYVLMQERTWVMLYAPIINGGGIKTKYIHVILLPVREVIKVFGYYIA